MADYTELVKAFGVPGAFIVWVIHTVLTSRPAKQPILMPGPDSVTKRDIEEIMAKLEKLDGIEATGHAAHTMIAEIKGQLAGMGRR